MPLTSLERAVETARSIDRDGRRTVARLSSTISSMQAVISVRGEKRLTPFSTVSRVLRSERARAGHRRQQLVRRAQALLEDAVVESQDREERLNYASYQIEEQMAARKRELQPR